MGSIGPACLLALTLCFSSAVAYAGNDRAPAHETIVIVANAWIREMHSEDKTTTGYMTLVNVSGAPVQLVGLRSPAFQRVEVHDTIEVNGLKMRRVVTPLDLPSGGLLVFLFGQQHITLMDPRYILYDGEVVPITLIFASGLEQTIPVRVARESPGPLNLALR